MNWIKTAALLYLIPLLLAGAESSLSRAARMTSKIRLKTVTDPHPPETTTKTFKPSPNVIIFIADDMGIGDSSAYQDLTGNLDHEQIDTPELERLARLGTRFTDAHSNGATCSPSRISLLSGVYSFRSPLKIRAVQDTEHVHGVIMPGKRNTIAHMLQRSGYATYGYGKWHMALKADPGEDNDDDGVLEVKGSGRIAEGPIESGFDTFTGTPGNFSYAGAMIVDHQYMRFGHSDANDHSLVPINSPKAVPWDGRGPNAPTDPNLQKVQPAVFKKLQRDMQHHMDAKSQEPFFIYYASHSNHNPYVPANYDPDHPDGPRASLNGKVIDTAVTKAGGMIHIHTVPDKNGDGIPDPDPKNNPRWIWNDAYRKKLWDHVSAVDDKGNLSINGPTNRAMMVQENDIIVGYMLDFLEQTDDPRNRGHKLIDNTIFIFTSDNGADIRGDAAAGALPQSSDDVITKLSGFKGSRWEGGNRIPFLAAWPKPADEKRHHGIPAGATSSALFGLKDIYATLAKAVGYSLKPDEAVDSESLLEAWTMGQQGVVRSTDLLTKFKQHIFSRRGSYKLSAMDPNFVTKLSSDRFADRNQLDFQNMVLDENKWKKYVRVLVDLSKDLSELHDLGIKEPGLSIANDMLSELNRLVSQGYSRDGATAFKNGVNFIGGSLFDAQNWHAYKKSRHNRAPRGETPGIVAVDGWHRGDMAERTLIHRNGQLQLSPGKKGGLNNSFYELDGGTLCVSSDLRLRTSRFEIYRGKLELGQHQLILEQGHSVFVLAGGKTQAQSISLGASQASDGSDQVLRVHRGSGILRLRADDALQFSKTNENENDYIDFVTGSKGKLISRLTPHHYEALYDSGKLRVDGVAGRRGEFYRSGFKVQSSDDGLMALSLE